MIIYKLYIVFIKNLGDKSDWSVDIVGFEDLFLNKRNNENDEL